MIRAVYRGPIAHLKGETAILQDGKAQFDNTNLVLVPESPLDNHPWFRLEKVRLGYGWHKFPPHHWEIINEPDPCPIQ